MHAASLPSSRRDFFAGSLKTGAALGALSLGGSALTAAAAPLMSASTQDDLLSQLGGRIAIDVQSAIGTPHAGYSVHFVDSAGAACQALRQGLREALSGHDLRMAEETIGHGHLLGVVTFRNLDSGRSLRVDLYPESLSQIALIEALPEQGRQARLAATPRDSLYGLHAG